jgi:hypothetical protein
MTTQYRWLIVLGVVILTMAVAACIYFRSRHETMVVDLLAGFPTARRQPGPEAMTLVEATIRGDTKRAILAQPLAGTRIIWHETIPEHAWLKFSLGLQESGWKIPGDGVLFMVGISDQRIYDGLLTVSINPFAVASDRRWTEVSLDLSSYAGRTVDIIFNTRSRPKDDRSGDFALWGVPRIVVQQ